MTAMLERDEMIKIIIIIEHEREKERGEKEFKATLGLSV